jgi:hypothetical protein
MNAGTAITREQEMTMKRLLALVFCLTSLMTLALFPEQTENEVTISEGKNISVLGTNNRNKWLVRIKDLDTSVVLVDMAAHNIAHFPLDGQSILSARFITIPYVNESIMEVITCTPQGNGNLYLFNTDFRILLTAKYYDSCHENADYSVFHATELFKNVENNGQTISRVYRNNHLDVDYRDVKNKMIKVYGICDYISHANDVDTAILSEPVEKYYKYSDKTKTFELMTNIGCPENKNWVSE